MAKAEKVVIDGVEYISSAKAAELVGYTKDYVGQLSRAGKVEATRVGRSWYISEDSIRKHKLASHYTLSKPKKVRKKENGDNEITSKNIDNSVKTNNIHKKQETDLIPNIVKKNKKDVLLETDISYLKESPKNNHVKSKKDTNDSYDFKKVVIKRTGTDKNARHSIENAPVTKKVFVNKNFKHNKKKIKNIPLDGIKTGGQKYYAKKTAMRKNDIVASKHYGFDTQTVRRKEKKVKNNFRILPVILFIFFITIAAVIYIFISV